MLQSLLVAFSQLLFSSEPATVSESGPIAKTEPLQPTVTENKMSSPRFKMSSSQEDIESGYGSASSDNGGFSDVYFSKAHLKFLNQQLSQLEPEGM
jgi:hypothetical protein